MTAINQMQLSLSANEQPFKNGSHFSTVQNCTCELKLALKSAFWSKVINILTYYQTPHLFYGFPVIWPVLRLSTKNLQTVTGQSTTLKTRIATKQQQKSKTNK